MEALANQEKESIKASNLAVGFPGKIVAQSLEITALPGQISVIAGPNGAGKSTLLKTLARQLKPLAGQVLFGTTDIFSLSAHEFAQKVAYVPQMLELGQDLTVYELVMLGRNPHQRWWSWSSSAADREAVEDALVRTSTVKLKSNYLSSLSGGERQRAIIACALAQHAQFMLLDEPTSHLDFRHQLELANLLKELCANGLGILVVLHDLNLIARLADQVFLIGKSEGEPSRIASSGSPAHVLEPITLRNVYQVEVSICIDPQSGSRVYTPTTYVQYSETP